MKNFWRKISWITLITTISVMALVYVCPMEMSESRNSSMAASVYSSCENTSVTAGALSLSRSNTFGDCINARIALVGQTLKNLTSVPGSFELTIVLSVLVVYFFTKIIRKFFPDILQCLLVRAQYFHRRYRTSTRLLIEKKLRRYLILLGNYKVVSIG